MSYGAKEFHQSRFLYSLASSPQTLLYKYVRFSYFAYYKKNPAKKS